MLSEHFISIRSRSQRSPAIMAYWSNPSSRTHVHPVKVGLVEYFFHSDPNNFTKHLGRRLETHIHTTLPTRPHRWLVASQRHTHIPAYKTAQMAGCRSETHTSLPTRLHRWLVAGQRHRFKSVCTSEVEGNCRHCLALQAGAAAP